MLNLLANQEVIGVRKKQHPQKNPERHFSTEKAIAKEHYMAQLPLSIPLATKTVGFENWVLQFFRHILQIFSIEGSHNSKLSDTFNILIDISPLLIIT